jgi:hypothetical protein
MSSSPSGVDDRFSDSCDGADGKGEAGVRSGLGWRGIPGGGVTDTDL